MQLPVYCALRSWDAVEEIQYERRGRHGFGVLLSLKYTSQRLVG
jgi:hypothetical protein